MKKLLQVFLLTLFAMCYMMAQDGDLNMSIVAHVPSPEGGSGVWHYVDKKHKTEYAVFGSRTAVVLYSLEDPTKPKERFRFTGSTTTWREVFSYGEFVYGVTDNAADGLVIIDMRKAPDTITGKFWKPSLTAGTQTANLGSCHTVFVDEKGILSLNGCTPWRGILFFDLNPDPMNPKFIGSELTRYCHDDYVRRDTLYSSEIYDGFVSIYDVKDYKNPKELLNIKTPFAFTHNSWISDDSKYIFTTDEKEEATVASYEISDFTKVKLLDQFKPKDTDGKGVIPHNTRYINGYLVTSYYTDGVKIIDAHKPDNLIEVGSFDTYFGVQTGGFYGTWGVSPYLPSGLIVASNIEDGLFIIRPNYVRACYLEGQVTDTITTLPINNVSITISALRKNLENSDASGNYKTGYATAGTYNVTFTHPDYYTKTIQATLVNGQITIKDVQLISKRPSITAKVIVKDSVSKQVLQSAQVIIFNINGSKNATTGTDGSVSLFVFRDTLAYDIIVGKWGYFHKKVKFETEKQAPVIEILVRRGYQDDFIFDQGWTINSTATSGVWTRATPTGTVYRNEQFQTDLDLQNDFGTECYVTGNTGTDPSADDVDNGGTTLTSPVMKLSNYKEPILSFYSWFANNGGDNKPNDKMIFRISNGNSVVFVKEVNTHNPKWENSGLIKLKELIPLTDSMRFIVDISDDVPGHLLEGAFDDFLVYDGIISDVSGENNDLEFSIHPTVVTSNSNLYYSLRTSGNNMSIKLLDVFGNELQHITPMTNTGHLNIPSNWPSGTYFLKAVDKDRGTSSCVKFIKQ